MSTQYIQSTEWTVTEAGSLHPVPGYAPSPRIWLPPPPSNHTTPHSKRRESKGILHKTLWPEHRSLWTLQLTVWPAWFPSKWKRGAHCSGMRQREQRGHQEGSGPATGQHLGLALGGRGWGSLSPEELLTPFPVKRNRV